jgi:hypothetical protein
MKAERRHELKRNWLAGALVDLPGFLREYGSRILLAVLFVALVIVLVYQYTTGRVVQDERSREALTSARESVDRVRQMVDQLAQMPFLVVPSDAIAKFRDEHINDAQKAIQVALQANDSSVKADAEVVSGDLDYLRAAIPPLPGSDTRPSLNNYGDRGREDLLRSAEDAYTRVISAPLNANKEALRNARFGLAAIAEDRSQWDKAKDFYEQIINDSSTPSIFKETAREREGNLTTLQKPILAASPASAPSPFLGPDLMSLLATQPSIATTQPSTQPAATQQTR